MLTCLPFRACGREVDTIDRRHEKLQQVPDEVLRNFRTLEECRLDANQIRELPRNFFRLRRIRFLTLSDNELTYIPSGLGSFVCLVELDLSRNDITELPKSIRFCDSLQTLELSNNPLQTLPDGFCELRNLRILCMNDISLTELPNDFGKLRLLEKCELRDNCLKNLPDSFKDLVNLELLDIGANEFHVVPLVVCALPNLIELLVDDNELRSLPPHIGQLQCLQQLDVSENLIDTLPEEMAGLISLSDLKLSQNNLNCLPSGIGHMKSLVVLKVDQNQLLTLTASIGNCSNLQELYLTENLLPLLPSTIGNLSGLLLLNADKNELTELPPQIGHCTSLTILSLRENRLKNLPEDVGNCCRLHVLDVSGNRINRLPPSLTNCPLTALWLSANQSQPVVTLQRDVDRLTGEHFLTCYLLPQGQADSQAEVGDTGLSPSEMGNFSVPVPTSGDAALHGDLARYYQNPNAMEDAFSRIPAETNYTYEAMGPLGELVSGSAVVPSWSATSGDGEEIEDALSSGRRRQVPSRDMVNSPPADTSTASFSSRTTATVDSPRRVVDPTDLRHHPQSSLSTTMTGNTTTTSSSSSPTSQHFQTGPKQYRDTVGDELDSPAALPFPNQLPPGSRVHFSSALDADDQSEHSSAKDFPKTLHPRLVRKSAELHHAGRDSGVVDRGSARDRQLTSPASVGPTHGSNDSKVTSPPSTLESPPSLSGPRSLEATVPTATSWRVPTGTGSPCLLSSPPASLSGEDRKATGGRPTSPLSSMAPDASGTSPAGLVEQPGVAPTIKPRKKLYGSTVAHTPDSTGKPRTPEAARPSGSLANAHVGKTSATVGFGDYDHEDAEDEAGRENEAQEEDEEEAYTSGGEEICGISKRVGFTDDVEDNEEKSNQKLIRRDTPHYTKRARIQSKAADGVENTEAVLRIMEKYLAGEGSAPTATLDDLHTSPLTPVTRTVGESNEAANDMANSCYYSLGSQAIRASQDSTVSQIHIHRPSGGSGLGLSIAGGVGSVPYLGEDQGIFVSRLNPDGLAYASGLRLHDKLLQVNGTSLVNVEHKVAVAALRANTNDFHLVILRYSPVGETSNGIQLFPFSTPTGHAAAQVDLTSPAQELNSKPQLIKCTLRRDGSMGLGLSIAGGRGSLPASMADRGETIVISKITENGAAHKCGKLRVGDQLIKVDGVDVKNARHEQVLLLLSGSGPIVDIEVLRNLDSHYSRTANGCDALQDSATSAPWLNQVTPIRKKETVFPDSLKSFSPGVSNKLSPTNREDGEIRRTDGSYSIDLVTIHLDDSSPLGLTIYGGSDTCCRPFGGSTNEPGIFISKISPDGRASRSGLRIGDRLLQVNEVDLRGITHDAAVQALIQSSSRELLLKVRHDPTPPGLRRLTIDHQPGERLGLRVAGGVTPACSVKTEFSSQLANDDGLFVTTISADGAVARDNRLRLGDRLLEVNGTWVMGSTLDEALTCFHGTENQLDLIVCDGPIEVVSQLSNSQTIAAPGVANHFSMRIRHPGGPVNDRSVDDAIRMYQSGEQKHQRFAGKQCQAPSAASDQVSAKVNQFSTGPILNRMV